MRTVLLTLLVSAPSWAEGAFGTWKMNPARSMFPGDAYPRSLTLRIEPHVKGEVFTMDTIYGDRRTMTFSTILYFDAKPRDFQGPKCSGTQSSRRVDNGTVEIMNKCANGEWTRFVRRLAAQPKELILDITEQHPDGSRFERRLVLDKQSEAETTQDKYSGNERRDR
jgi:hypothetical protein